MNDLLDLLAETEVADGTVLAKLDSHPDGVRCLYCREPLVPAYSIVHPYRCEVAHIPVTDGECFRVTSTRHRIKGALEALEQPTTRGNCWAIAHRSVHKGGGWFGEGKVPTECIEQELTELRQKLEEVTR